MEEAMNLKKKTPVGWTLLPLFPKEPNSEGEVSVTLKRAFCGQPWEAFPLLAVPS